LSIGNCSKISCSFFVVGLARSTSNGTRKNSKHSREMVRDKLHAGSGWFQKDPERKELKF
jgi:hypothetical protein